MNWAAFRVNTYVRLKNLIYNYLYHQIGTFEHDYYHIMA